VDVLSVGSLDEALDAKSRRPEAVPIAGGTDVMVAINGGAARPDALLDLGRVRELSSWQRSDHELALGAGLSYTAIQRDLPDERVLVQAARSVGSPQIRNRGTVGGNVGTASPAGDLLPVLAAADAEIELGADGGRRRSVPWDRFFVGPKRTSLGPDELILAVRWRRLLGPGVFAKVGPRNAMVISIASICLLVDEEGRGLRVALGSVGPTVLRAPEAERFAAEAVAAAGGWGDAAALPADADIARFAELAAEAAAPIDDRRGTAAYRRHAVGVLAERALRWVLADRRAARDGG
jgi:CO/xanthine dehydrogenase FAD-binding subunit